MKQQPGWLWLPALASAQNARPRLQFSLDRGSNHCIQYDMAPAPQNELDELVANTMAFVNSIKDGQLEPVVNDGGVATMAVANIVAEGPHGTEPVDAVVAVLNQALADKSPRPFSPMTWPTFGREEVTRRVANFKAYQLRMKSEREDYYFQTMARTRTLVEQCVSAKTKMMGTKVESRS
jgi:hypothetical protein